MDEEKVYRADMMYTCSFPGFKKAILPGENWKYAWLKVVVDDKGQGVERLVKVHAHHPLKEK